MADGQPDGVPFLRVVRGDATPEEIAAVVAVIAAVRSRPAEGPAPEPVRANWNARARLLHAPTPRGPGAWRRSVLP